MNSYLINFAVYTLAMIGFIALSLFIYKKSMYSSSVSKNKNFLKVENSLRLSAAKTIYVLSAGDEKFLIAGDAANTTMLAKLNETPNLVPHLAADTTPQSKYPSLRAAVQKISNLVPHSAADSQPQSKCSPF